MNIREIRNQIAHEYVELDIRALFFDVLHYVPEMKKIIKNVNEYYDQNLSQTHPEFFKEGRRSE